MDPDEAVLIANGEGITNIRILQSVGGRTTTPMSADLRRNRLNLMIEDGTVVEAMFC
jgi:hypothetical protein